MVTREELEEWYQDGKEGIYRGTTHLVRLSDLADPKNPFEFPQYVFKDETLDQKLVQYDEASGLKVIGVFALDKDFENQYRDKYSQDKPKADSDEPTVATADLRSNLSKTFPISWGNRFHRFLSLLSEQLEKHETVTVEGLIWACEWAMSDSRGYFEQADRVTFRNKLPDLADYIISDRAFRDAFILQCEEIKTKTLNLH